MKSVRVLAFALVLALILPVAAEDKKEAKFDAEKMSGDWNVTAGKKAGQAIGDDNRAVHLARMCGIGIANECRHLYLKTEFGFITDREHPMTTRKMGGIGATACVLAFVVMTGLPRFGVSEDKKPAAAAHMHDDAMMTCAKACSDCQLACDSCASHCGHKLHEGMKEHHASLVSCQDCATACAAAAQIVARSGPYSTAICATCAEVCGKCAAECEKFPNDAHMKACGEECRKCEKACKAMTAHH